MNLVEEYLRAVAVLLPKDKRDDIIEELRELILSRIESLQSDLGRSLTDAEIEDLLRALGHPLVVASRYRDGPQHIVGPTLYPFWIFAVKVAVTIQLAIAVIIFLVRALTGDFERAFGQAIASGFTGALILIGVATVMAWLIEREVIRIDYFDNWRVKDLAFLSFASLDADAWRDWLQTHSGSTEPKRQKEASSPAPKVEGPFSSKRLRRRYGWPYGYRYTYYAYSPVGRGLAGIAAAVVLLLWWLGFIHFGIAGSMADFHSIGIEPGALATADWIAVKRGLYLPVLAFVGLTLTQGVVRVAHPGARRVHGQIDIAAAILVLFTVGWVWTLSPIASAVRVETLAAFAQRLRDLFHNGPPFPLAPGLTLVLVVIGFGAVMQAIQGVFELISPSPAPWPPYARGVGGQ